MSRLFEGFDGRDRICCTVPSERIHVWLFLLRWAIQALEETLHITQATKVLPNVFVLHSKHQNFAIFEQMCLPWEVDPIIYVAANNLQRLLLSIENESIPGDFVLDFL